MEKIECSLCGSNKANFYVSGKDFLTSRSGEWNYYKCSNCAYIFIFPLPKKEELTEYYNSDEKKLHYHHFVLPPAPTGALGKMKARLKKIAMRYFLNNEVKVTTSAFEILLSFLFIRPLKIHLSPVSAAENSRILEIGCGNGERIGLLKNYGFKNISANEFNTDLASKIEEHYGIKVWTADIRSIKFEERFQFIVSSMVLEHIEDPKSFIKRVHDILEPGGVFAFSVPNISGVEAKIFQNTFYGLQPPYHISQFSPESLKYLLSDFKKVEFYFQAMDRDWVISSRRKFEEQPSLLNWIFNFGKYKFLRKLFLKPFILLLSFLGQTSRMTVYAYK